MTAMPIYGKKTILKPDGLGLGMKHWGYRAYQVYSNDDPELTLSYLTSMSNLLPNAFKWEYGAQWLSGRVLDSRPRGHGFEPHRRHCVVVLSKTHLS